MEVANDIFKKMQNDGAYAIKIIFDNNPVGFCLSFALYGFDCNAKTTDEAIDFVRSLYLDNGTENLTIAKALVNVPRMASAGNYTDAPEYQLALDMYDNLKVS